MERIASKCFLISRLITSDVTWNLYRQTFIWIHYFCFDSSVKFFIISLMISLMIHHLEYCVQFWTPQYRKDIDVLEQVQRRARRLVKSFKSMTYLGLRALMKKWLRHASFVPVLLAALASLSNKHRGELIPRGLYLSNTWIY